MEQLYHLKKILIYQATKIKEGLKSPKILQIHNFGAAEAEFPHIHVTKIEEYKGKIRVRRVLSEKSKLE